MGVKPVPAARSMKVSFFSTTIRLKGPKGLLNSTWSPTFLPKIFLLSIWFYRNLENVPVI